MEHMKIDPELPSGLDSSEYEAARHAALEGAILCLYRDGAISGGRAARELAMGLDVFLLWAAQHGVPVLQSTCDQLAADSASALDAAGCGGL